MMMMAMMIICMLMLLLMLLLLRPLAGAKYCNRFVCHAVKYHPGQSRSSILPGWLMEQPSLFETAGVYAGDMELVLSPSLLKIALALDRDD